MEIKPILFSTPMVQAILEGRKTQTRRVIKPQPDFDSAWKNLSTIGGKVAKNFLKEDRPGLEIPNISVSSSLLGVRGEDGLGTGICQPNIVVPYHKGDILWVRETFADVPFTKPEKYHGYAYRADWEENDQHCPVTKWKPSIFMPKAACRIFLEVTNVRVERLQDISEEDAIAEGIQFHFEEMFQEFRYRDYDKKLQAGYGDPAVDYPTWRDPISSFKSLWEHINGRDSWEANPWVWVYDFKQVEKPENFLK